MSKYIFFWQMFTLQIGLKKLKIPFRGHMLLMILIEKKLLEAFIKKDCKKTNQKEFIVEKLIKKIGDKLYVKWNGYDSSFNSWIDKKDIV